VKREHYQPSPLARVSVQTGERATIVFVRELPHSPELVWNALTDPAELQQWAPFDADRNLSAPGEALLTMAGEGGGEKLPCVVRRSERPRLLEYTWGNDVLCWQLEAIASGTRLTLSPGDSRLAHLPGRHGPSPGRKARRSHRE
jgi:hypothetical protein